MLPPGSPISGRHADIHFMTVCALCSVSSWLYSILWLIIIKDRLMIHSVPGQGKEITDEWMNVHDSSSLEPLPLKTHTVCNYFLWNYLIVLQNTTNTVYTLWML